VPSDYQTAVTSINLGNPLVQSDAHCKIAAEIRRIAHIITGRAVVVEEQPSRRTLWNSLFKKESSPSASRIRFQTSMEKV
jgi:hypothetical protein